jgi:hypothetical protein
LIFGRAPNIAPPRKKYAELWEALERDPKAWVGTDLTDLTSGSLPLKKGVIKGAAHRVGLVVDVVVAATSAATSKNPSSSRT